MEKTLDGKGRKAEPSRSGKRRANAEPVEEEAQNDESSDDAFEKMDLDKQEGIVAASQEASSERQTTPEPATGSETESDPEPDRAQPISRTKQAQKPQTGSQNPTTSRPTQSQTGKKIHPSPPPPVRHLPFAKTGARNTGTSKQDSESAQKQQPKAPVRAKADEGAGEETASEDDDDEL